MNWIAAAALVLEGALNSPVGRESAYLDPGSGSFILQLVIASAVGLLFVLRGYWSRFLDIFRGSSGSMDEDETDPNQEE